MPSIPKRRDVNARNAIVETDDVRFDEFLEVKVAKYCSRECQRQHFREHKHACKVCEPMALKIQGDARKRTRSFFLRARRVCSQTAAQGGTGARGAAAERDGHS